MKNTKPALIMGFLLKASVAKVFSKLIQIGEKIIFPEERSQKKENVFFFNFSENIDFQKRLEDTNTKCRLRRRETTDISANFTPPSTKLHKNLT